MLLFHLVNAHATGSSQWRPPIPLKGGEGLWLRVYGLWRDNSGPDDSITYKP